MTQPTTGIPIVDWALALLAAHGYLFTIAATVAENLPVIGSLTPGETVVLAAGFVSSTGALHPLAVYGVAVIGTVIGSNIGYFTGRNGGRPMLERYGQRFLVGERRLKDAEGFFLRHGSKTVLFARFAPGVKNFAPVIAGISHMRLAVFEAYTLLGAALYAAVMVALGYFFGSNFPLLLKIVNRAGWVGGAIALAVIAALLWERRRFIVRRQAIDIAVEEAAEAAEAASAAEADDGRG